MKASYLVSLFVVTDIIALAAEAISFESLLNEMVDIESIARWPQALKVDSYQL
jgi:hypothetical protein